MNYDVEYIRRQFPALSLQVGGQPAAYFDGPGGTQVPQRVLDAMVAYLVGANANAGGPFHTSRESDRIVEEARLALADFLGAGPREVSFGQNTTTLMFSLALALGRGDRDLVPKSGAAYRQGPATAEVGQGDRDLVPELGGAYRKGPAAAGGGRGKPGRRPGPGKRNEILITQLDHEANRGPWEDLQELGYVVREARIDPETCTVDLEDFAAKLSERTRVAAFGYASNSVGTVSDVKEMTRLAHQAGALAVVDAVHYALHGPLDVKDLGVDFLLCSAYKFFGPHLGILYGKEEVYRELPTYRLKVQSAEIPHRIETGTLNHEGIAGAREAVEFIADVGERFGLERNDEGGGPGGEPGPEVAGGLRPGQEAGTGPEGTPSRRRQKVVAGMKAMEAYEQPLAEHLREELAALKGVKVYGPPKGHPRTSTVSFTMENVPSGEVAAALGEKGIFVWHGHFYASRLVEVLNLEGYGGLVRVGLSPYNTEAEIQRLLKEVRRLSV